MIKRLSGRNTIYKDSHPSNALSPILLKVEGKFIEINDFYP
jgi:hypothetical protein